MTSPTAKDSTVDFSAASVQPDPRLLTPVPILAEFYSNLWGRGSEVDWQPARVLSDFTGLACRAPAGSLVKVTLLEDAQVVALFPFNSDDPDERFWHQSGVREGFFLKRLSRLWGTMARCRPLMTLLEDTVTTSGPPPGHHHPILAGLESRREWDAAGGNPRVAPVWDQFAALMQDLGHSTHFLTENISLFRKARFSLGDQRLVTIPSDAVEGDSLVFFSEIDLQLLFALSPHVDDRGSRSIPDPRAVEIAVSAPVAEPLPWPYPGIPYPDLSLYLDRDGRRSRSIGRTRGIPNQEPEARA